MGCSSEGRKEKAVAAESRADLDQNWRNHESPDLANGNQVNSLPPSGAKNRKTKSAKSNTEREEPQQEQQQPSEKPKARAKSEEKETREKPANTKLDINKLRSVVQRNILDND